MEPTQNKPQAPKIPAPVVVPHPVRGLQDPAGFDISAHIKITDPQTNTVIVNQRG